jgi:hypothetical protein
VAPAEPDVLALARGAWRVRIVDGGWIAADLAGNMPDLASIAGISLGVADVDKSATLLAHNGAGYQRIPGAVTVSRDYACGTFTEFQSARG